MSGSTYTVFPITCHSGLLTACSSPWDGQQWLQLWATGLESPGTYDYFRELSVVVAKSFQQVVKGRLFNKTMEDCLDIQ